MSKYEFLLTGKSTSDNNLKFRAVAFYNKGLNSELVINIGTKEHREEAGIKIIQKAFKKKNKIKHSSNMYAYLVFDGSEADPALDEVIIYAHTPKSVKSFSEYNDVGISVYNGAGTLIFKYDFSGVADSKAVSLFKLQRNKDLNEDAFKLIPVMNYNDVSMEEVEHGEKR